MGNVRKHIKVTYIGDYESSYMFNFKNYKFYVVSLINIVFDLNLNNSLYPDVLTITFYEIIYY